MLFIGSDVFLSILFAAAVPDEIPETAARWVQQVQPAKINEADEDDEDDEDDEKTPQAVRLPQTIRIEGVFYDFEDDFYFYDRYWKWRYPKHKYYFQDGKRHHRIITPVRARYTPAFRRFPKPKGMRPPKGPPPKHGMRPPKGPPPKHGMRPPPHGRGRR